MNAQIPTVAAFLTPLAPGAIAVLGLTGPGVDEILARVLRRRGSDGSVELADRRPILCRLVEGNEVLDDVVVVRIAQGGQVVAEINTHGGVRVVQRALLLLEKHGATIVDADRWAAHCGTSDPLERDVDRTLLRVSSRRLTNWLLSQRRILPPFLARLGSLDSEELAAFRERSRAAVRLVQGLRVALIGPPNAGKSTLANRLIGSDRVITSPEPGTTRDWVAETAFIRGWPVTLTDTAGIRETTCPVEAEAVRRARQQAEQADLVVVVLDATTPAEDARNFLDELVQAAPAGQQRLVVRNKCDLCFENRSRGWHGRGFGRPCCQPREEPFSSEMASEPLMKTCSEEQPDSPPACGIAPMTSAGISALTGAGVEAMERQIESALGLDQLDDSLPTAFLPRQLTR